MNTYRRFVASVLLCLTAVALRPVFAQEATLRYHWTKGEELRHRQTLQSTTTMSGPGLPAGMNGSPINSTMVQILRTIVDDVAADGTVTLREFFDAVRMEVDTPMGTAVFDSAATDNGSPADPLSKSLGSAYRAMIGESITLVISPTGAVQKLEGMTRILEKMISSQPDAVRTTTLDVLKKSFSDDAPQYMSSRGLTRFPQRPLKPGDTWDDQVTFNVPMFGSTTISRRWLMQRIEDRDATQTATLTSKLTGTAIPNTEPQAVPLPVMHWGESSGESELLFDLTRGRLLRVSTQLSQSMTMTPPQLGGAAAANIQMMSKSTVTLELLGEASR